MQAKLNMRALLDQVFPEYEKVFSNLFSATSLHVLARCLEDQAEDLHGIIQKNAGKSHSKKWAEVKTEHLREVLSRWSEEPKSPAQTS
ncbi:hypothetical protein, partial [Acinetobacter sp. AGC35]